MGGWGAGSVCRGSSILVAIILSRYSLIYQAFALCFYQKRKFSFLWTDVVGTIIPRGQLLFSLLVQTFFARNRISCDSRNGVAPIRNWKSRKQ